MDPAEEALVNCADTSVYLQAGRLVRPLVEEAHAARGRKTTVTRISQLTSSSLRYHLSMAPRWSKWNTRSKSLAPADPPRDVAEGLLAHGTWRLFKELVGVIETQTLRPDLTVLSEPGCDPATGLLLSEPAADAEHSGRTEPPGFKQPAWFLLHLMTTPMLPRTVFGPKPSIAIRAVLLSSCFLRVHRRSA